MVHETAWHFGNEGLVKTNFCVKGDEQSITQLSIIFENFKISSLHRYCSELSEVGVVMSS